MSNYVFHNSKSRGLADHGWLVSRHTFSFAGYYNPDRIQFGALRVLNDDIVQPGMGFGTHPHNNMEIISIPLSGSLAHKDSTGNEKAIHTGEVQIMSAGSGLYHSEYNYSKTSDVNFLQIWVLPKELEISPIYDQKDFSKVSRQNSLSTVVAPDDKNALWINQNAWFSLGKFDSGQKLTYSTRKEGNGTYVFLISGEAELDGNKMFKRDGLGISNSEKFEISFTKESEVLVMDIPMEIN